MTSLQQMADDMGHCGNIASSALVLASERSSDIDVPIVITLMMLKKLCEANITVQLSEKLPENMMRMADAANLDIETIRKQAFAGMEELIDDYFKYQKLVRKDFRG